MVCGFKNFIGSFITGGEEVPLFPLLQKPKQKNLQMKENGGLDFGEDVKFMPTKLMMKFRREEMNNESLRGSRTVIRYANRKPQLAFVSILPMNS